MRLMPSSDILLDRDNIALRAAIARCPTPWLATRLHTPTALPLRRPPNLTLLFPPLPATTPLACATPSDATSRPAPPRVDATDDAAADDAWPYEFPRR
jgi:hypothetical protein